MAPSRGGFSFNASPSYGRAAVEESRPSDGRLADAFGSRKRGTLKQVESSGPADSGHERVSSGFAASTSESSAFRGSFQELVQDNAAQQTLPMVDEANKKAGSRVAPSGPVSWGDSLKYAVQSWFLGFWEALMIHRTVRILARFVLLSFSYGYFQNMDTGTRSHAWSSVGLSSCSVIIRGQTFDPRSGARHVPKWWYKVWKSWLGFTNLLL